MKLVALPAFSDNYIWMLHDGRQAIVVDPGQAPPVEQALARLGLELVGILVTHHHPDHVGGVQALRSRLTGVVHGPARETIPTPFEPVTDGQHFELLGCAVSVIDVPGHTAGHVAYRVDRPADSDGRVPEPILFCGDTLFSGGCGRLFEGTPAQMHASLQRLASLPDDTAVCCAHEYTLSNLRFALAVEPDNGALVRYVAHCESLRAGNLPTLPSSIACERAVNPFLRCSEPGVVAAARRQGSANDEPAQVLAALRQWKNNFR